MPAAYSGRGRLARPVLFRRALKIINGGMAASVNNLPAAGFTVTSENPVYVQGNFNATTRRASTAEPNVGRRRSSRDSITLLSNAFNDALTFLYPERPGQPRRHRHGVPLRDGHRQGRSCSRSRRAGA